MDTWLLSVFAFIAVSSFVSPSLGFSLDNLGLNHADFQKAIGERDTAVGQPSEKTPAGALVDVLSELLDSNGDREVGLAEVRQRIERYNQARVKKGYEESPMSSRFLMTFSGPIMTVATLIDADDSGSLNRNELERASNIMVRETGSPAVTAIFLETTYWLQGQEDDAGNDFTEQDAVAAVQHALDSNGDGAISNAELQVLRDTSRFRYSYDTLDEMANRADRDGNDLLNVAEIREWLEMLEQSDSYYTNRLILFARIADRLGREVTLQWASSNY